MTTSIAEYYLTELNDWTNSLNFHLEEIEASQERLDEILHLNSVPDLAASVEHYLNQLFLSRQNQVSLRTHIHTQEQKLHKNYTPVGNDLVTEELKKLQKELRTSMHTTEKEYLDIKYACDEFIAQTILQQNKKNEKRKSLAQVLWLMADQPFAL